VLPPPPLTVPVSAGALEPHALINATIAIRAGTADARRFPFIVSPVVVIVVTSVLGGRHADHRQPATGDAHVGDERQAPPISEFRPGLADVPVGDQGVEVGERPGDGRGARRAGSKGLLLVLAGCGPRLQ
jgi:hypothetical protein